MNAADTLKDNLSTLKDNLSANVKDNLSSVEADTKEKLSQAKAEIKKSGVDWVEYIKAHPIQSVAFAISLAYSVKGFFNYHK